MSQALPVLLLVSLINGTLFCVSFEMISVIEWVWVVYKTVMLIGLLLRNTD